jgi:hypothetical protein
VKLPSLQSSSGGEASSTLPALLGVIAAILLWYVGEELRAKLPPLAQQLKTASTLVQRGSTPQLASLKADAAGARTEREAIEFRLRSDDTEQLARARLVFELRQRCDAAKLIGCSVRLSDETTATRIPVAEGSAGSGRADTREAETTLESLGINKARAVVSGTFRSDEIGRLCADLQADTAAMWRVNGLVVRGNSFELDVERHIRPSGLAPVAKP